MNIYTDGRFMKGGNVGNSQAYKAQSGLAPTQQPAQWTIVREEYNGDHEPSMFGSGKTQFVKPITVTDKKPHKLTITMNESDYERLQKLYDFLGSYTSLDDMVRQMLLQPEMHYLFVQFMGIVGKAGVDFTTNNQPEGFGWC